MTEQLLMLVAGLAFAYFPIAQSSHIERLIIGRSRPTITVQGQDMGNVIVVLSDNIQVITPEAFSNSYTVHGYSLPITGGIGF